MADLITSGRIVDMILVLVVIEAVGLYALHRFTGRGPRFGALLPNLAAGAALLLALKAALSGSGWMPIAGALLLAFAAHLWDLWSRWH